MPLGDELRRARSEPDDLAARVRAAVRPTTRASRQFAADCEAVLGTLAPDEASSFAIANRTLLTRRRTLEALFWLEDHGMAVSRTVAPPAGVTASATRLWRAA